ncbi:MAG: Gfo/Idh/MocA family oxidoreductase, partial [Proteobacteria bacterium]|nr:Gfo/Idh/MocA family oxidoreductase [Pseudomonadota bacterium]
GRYDVEFEERGIDYPIGYVRWTETRNLDAFLAIVESGQVKLEPLITHRYSIDEAPRAYELLADGGRENRPLGMVLRYSGTLGRLPAVSSDMSSVIKPVSGPIAGLVGVGFIGAGSFARSTLMPAFQRQGDARLEQVVTANGLSAFDAQKSFGFRRAGTDVDELLANPRIQLVCIATRHDSHADLVVRALEAGKHVFVEKPLALNEAQLARVIEANERAPGLVLVGFNRRFSPMADAIRHQLTSRGPMMMFARMNGGNLGNHWLNDERIGGGRMVGEGCHLVDLLSFFTDDQSIVSVEAQTPATTRRPQDYAVQLRFADGSIGIILYTSLGDVSMGHERIEVYSGGASAYIDDFIRGRVFCGGRSRKLKQRGRGHEQEVAALVAAVKGARPSPIAFSTLVGVTRTTFEVHDALAKRTAL